MTRPLVAVYIAVSLDHYIARDDGSLDWLARVQGDGGEDYGYAAFMASVDALVLGRSTWDTVLGFDAWPYEAKRVVVLTHRALSATHGEETHAGALAPLFERLGAEGVTRVYLDGGAAIRQALAEGLVDELTLSVVPVLLGAGRPLFARGLPELSMRLVEAKGYPSGLAQLRYVRA
jgi:dihydrofolate reductase